MAKLHVRHMVGGHAPGVRNERLCRFEFPERPGALTQFLEKLGGRWNISLFHYRNHGADFGRVLAGFEVADERPGRRSGSSSTSSDIRTRRSRTTPRTSSSSGRSTRLSHEDARRASKITKSSDSCDVFFVGFDLFVVFVVKDQ